MIRFVFPLRVVTLALLLVVAACASPPPREFARGEPGYAPPPRAGGALAESEQRVARRLGADRSGFHLLEANEEALRWRLALADAAEHSLDLQYYVWWGDESGNLLMKKVLDAADRGVKVRIILDDLSTALDDESHPRVRDRDIAGIDAHPNIQVRVFNPWQRRSLPGRAIEMLERLERINHRMHNKLMVADNRAAIVGGRNIGNEYFGLSPHFNFRDLDVLGIGPVARQASGVFDRFWNSEWVAPVRALAGTEDGGAPPERNPALARLAAAPAPALARLPIHRHDWREALSTLAARMHAGTSYVHTDTPTAERIAHHMPEAVHRLLATARRELLITNAYIIPSADDVERLRGLAARGTRIRVLTNSLASHDVPAVNSHYKGWRGPLIDAGVELHEMRSDAAVQAELADTPPTRAGFMGLHVKAMVIDRQRVFIGSMNLDPRSEALNTEMGVVIDSPELGQRLAESMDRDMSPDNSWRVSRTPDGGLRWTSRIGEQSVQPARDLWQRIQDVIFMAFPRDLY